MTPHRTPVRGSSSSARVALVRSGTEDRLLALQDDSTAEVLLEGPTDDVLARLRDLDKGMPRWVWWQRDVATDLARRGVRLTRAWDLQEVHRLLAGGSSADVDEVVAAAAQLPLGGRPPPPTGDLFDTTHATPLTHLRQQDGYLHPAALERSWPPPDRLKDWAELALQVAQQQETLLRDRGPRAVATAHAESTAGLLCSELEVEGLPLDLGTMHALIAEAAGRRPVDERDARRLRAVRDEQVLRHVPGRERTDLRNPAQVLELLNAVGVRVTDTRAWSLEAHAGTHPVVPALLTWRKAERIATTYGWHWLDEHVGPDRRLRGRWTVCDGGAGRMTAGAGLHSLPAPLRPGVAAEPGFALVRADLGQVEPRVLAAVSGDPAFLEATLADDLYADVAAQLGVERQVAKIGVLAAMYGQTSGTAGRVLPDLDRTYPRAMAFLRAAAGRGEQGRPVTTYGGRLVPVPTPSSPEHCRAIGRFTRNAVVQGAAAELFKAWALTVRAGLRAVDERARIVLMLHDELVLHVPEPAVPQALDVVDRSLRQAGHHWSGGAPLRLVSDTTVVHRWSEAKD